MYQWLCRKISGCMALLVLAVSAYCYQDLNIVNNQLLLEIKKQNQQLREDLLGMFFSFICMFLILSAHIY